MRLPASILAVFLALPVSAADRVALVIGNATYVHETTLSGPANDAEQMASVLADLGFDVTTYQDLPKNRTGETPSFEQVLAEFEDKAAQAETAILYFSGHGMKIGRTNYLIPVDARLETASDARWQAIRLDDARAAVARASRLSLVIIDACRNNRFPYDEDKGGDKGLQRVVAEKAELVAFSTAPGTVAKDAETGPSPYTRALIERLQARPAEDVRILLSSLAGPTRRYANAPQIPYLEVGQFPDDGIVCLAQDCSTPAPQPRATCETAEREWALVRDRTSPQVLETYIAKHGACPLYVSLAEERLAELRASPRPAVSVEPETADPPPPAPITEVEIAEAQRALNRLGFDAGIVDGIPGRKTRTAILGYQRRQGLPQTGLPDWPTIEALRASLESLPPDPHPDLSAFRDCSDCPEMVVIPAGDFLMGSPDTEDGRDADEGPQRRVTVEKFALARTEVTFNQWAACVADGGCRSTPRPDDEGWGKGDRPVINVSWHDAQEYVAWLNSKVSGSPYRLPSEAEWEYAARANSTTAYPWGPRISRANANYGTDECCDGLASGPDRWTYTAPAGQFPANGFMLHDMIGNVWEWVEDCWHGSYRNAPVTAVPWLQANGGDCSGRMVRGGSWGSTPRFLRSAYRGGDEPELRNGLIGFRPARTLVTP